MKIVIQLTGLFMAFLLLSGCNPSFSSHDAPLSANKAGVMKETLPNIFLNQIVIPYQEGTEQFQAFVDWFDSNTVLFIAQKNELNCIYKYDLFTGEKTLFYSSEQPILQVDSNHTHTYFAVQMMQNNQENSIVVLNREGKETFSWKGFAQGVQTIWSPYEQQKFLLSAVFKDWQFLVYIVDVDTGEMSEIAVKNPFVQWVNEQTLVYLDWNEFEPSFSAPLSFIDMKTGQAITALENIYAVFSFPNTLFAISSANPKQRYVDFIFYDTKGHTVAAMLKSPVLDTFSEHMWIPNHDFDEEKQVFYYMNLTYPSDISSYDGNYELTAFSLKTQRKQIIHVFKQHVPFKLSPEGTWCLVGYRFEQVINLDTGNIYALLL